ncbi:MAG: PHB depolymerase family esterase [Chitinophagales bacterium]
MKINCLLILLFCAILKLSQAQTTVLDTFNFDGLERNYILYVPAIYDGANAVPLVINLHGYGSNAAQQNFYGNFKNLADVDNFLVVLPDGTKDLSGTPYWNSFAGNGTVDDVAFISGLIDTLSQNYNIDPAKIFSTGMSNGGFMSYRLACELNNRISKIASVTGSMNTTLQGTCSPGAPIPVMQIHGTNDPTVPYNGSFGVVAIENVVDYWVNNNNCESVPIVENLPDINTADNSTVERYTYVNGDAGSSVIFYKVIGGGHTWPDAAIPIPAYGPTNRDFNASQVIWEFFKGESFVGVNDRDVLEGIAIKYNNEVLRINIPESLLMSNIQILNTVGQVIISSLDTEISTTNLSTGLYFVSVQTETGKYSQSFFKY